MDGLSRFAFTCHCFGIHLSLKVEPEKLSGSPPPAPSSSGRTSPKLHPSPRLSARKTTLLLFWLLIFTLFALAHVALRPSLPSLAPLGASSPPLVTAPSHKSSNLEPLRSYAHLSLDWDSAAPGEPPSKCTLSEPSGGALPLTVQRACVVGERHSGTNYISSLLDLNFRFTKPPKWGHPSGKFVAGAPTTVGQGCLAHKHMPQTSSDPGAAASLMSETVAFVVVRNPVDWLAGMCRLPFESNETSGRSVAECASKPWRGDKVTVGRQAVDYESLFAVRAAKYGGWLGQPWPHVVLVEYECLLARGGEGSKEFMTQLRERFNFPLNPFAQRLGWRIPVRYGLNNFGPYGHGPLSVPQLESSSAVAVLAVAAGGVAQQQRARGMLAHAAQPPHDPLTVARALAQLPQFDAKARAYEGELGYGPFLKVVAAAAAVAEG